MAPLNSESRPNIFEQMSGSHNTDRRPRFRSRTVMGPPEERVVMLTVDNDSYASRNL